MADEKNEATTCIVHHASRTKIQYGRQKSSKNCLFRKFFAYFCLYLRFGWWNLVGKSIGRQPWIRSLIKCTYMRWKGQNITYIRPFTYYCSIAQSALLEPIICNFFIILILNTSCMISSLVCGDVNGKLKTLYTRVANILKKSGDFEVKSC